MYKVLLWCHRRSEPVAHIRPLVETSTTCGAGILSISPWACLEHQMDYGWDEIWKNTCKTFYKTVRNLQITKLCISRERFLLLSFLGLSVDNTTIFLASISSPSTSKINVKIIVLVFLLFFFSPFCVWLFVFPLPPVKAGVSGLIRRSICSQ